MNATISDARWQQEARDVLYRLASEKHTFTADDMWEALAKWEVPAPREPRMLAAVLADAKKDGLIAATQMYAASRRRHGSPIRVWRSLVLPDISTPADMSEAVVSRISTDDNAPVISGPSVIAVAPVGLTEEMVRSLTKEQWEQILDPEKGSVNRMLNMKGYVRIRTLRMIRLLRDGRVYDDPKEDGRKLTKEEREAA